MREELTENTFSHKLIKIVIQSGKYNLKSLQNNKIIFGIDKITHENGEPAQSLKGFVALTR